MTALNLTALGLSLVAVIITLRQTVYVRQSNHLPLIVDILREFRSAEFQRDYNYVLAHLAAETQPRALSELRGAERDAAVSVAYFFQSIAYLVVYRIMSEEMVVAVLKTPIGRSLAILKPYIEEERKKAEGMGRFRFFEHLAERAEKISLQEVGVRRKLEPYEMPGRIGLGQARLTWRPGMARRIRK